MSEAKGILKRNQDKYDKSTLFIYFQGRLERIEVSGSPLLSFELFPLSTVERPSTRSRHLSQWIDSVQHWFVQCSSDENQRIRADLDLWRGILLYDDVGLRTSFILFYQVRQCDFRIVLLISRLDDVF